MSFKPGDEVTVLTLKRRGRVVEAHDDKYRVAVGGLMVAVTGCDLAAPEASGRKRRTRPREEPPDTSTTSERHQAVRRVDLHGFTVEQAREAVMAAVNDAILSGEASLEVLHGVGTGRVREAVRRALKDLSVVRSVRPHPTNHGITVVYL